MPSPPELEKARRDRDGKMGNSMEGKARIMDEETQRLQALQMIAMRVGGQSFAKIGNQMGVSPDTVKDRLAWARNQGLLADAEDRIVNELVPAAIQAFKKALDEGMYEAARDVLFGTGLLSKDAKRATEQVEMTLEQWREQRKAKIVVTTSPQSGLTQEIVSAFQGGAAFSGESVVESGSGDSVSPVELLLPFETEIASEED